MRGSITMDAELDIVYWCIVADKLNGSSVSILGETQESREKRHNGTQPNDGKETLQEFDEEMNAFVNKIRKAGDHDKLLQIIKVVSNEAARLEAERVRQRLANSSVA